MQQSILIRVWLATKMALLTFWLPMDKLIFVILTYQKTTQNENEIREQTLQHNLAFCEQRVVMLPSLETFSFQALTNLSDAELLLRLQDHELFLPLSLFL